METWKVSMTTKIIKSHSNNVQNPLNPEINYNIVIMGTKVEEAIRIFHKVLLKDIQTSIHNRFK